MIRDILIKDNNVVVHKTMNMDSDIVKKFDDSAEGKNYHLKIDINKVFTRLIKTGDINLFADLVNSVQDVYSDEDCEEFIYKFISSYLNSKNRLTVNEEIDTIISNIKDNKKFIFNKIAAEVINTYYGMYVSRFTKEDLFKIISFSDNDLKEYFANLGEELPVNVISDNALNNSINRYIIYAVKNNIYLALFKNTHTLCWDCPSNICLYCPKIEKDKYTIDKYSFITSGFQVYEDDDLKRFVVSDCKKMRKIRKKA